MDDHDQRLKTLLREFLPEFFALFFPNWAARLNFVGTEFLDQEAFLDPPQGEKRLLDVVAKVSSREPVPDPAGRGPEQRLIVIHVEVESSDRATDIRPRMWQYYEFLRRQHGLPVVPVCLFLRVGLDGIGWDTYEERLWDHPLLRFDYAYVGLPSLDGTQYVSGENLLGVALSALMKLPAAERARIKAEGLARIARSRENDARKYLLAECFANYIKLTAAEQTEFDRMQAAQFPEGKIMVTGWRENWQEEGRSLGLAEGRAEGQALGLRKAARRLMEKKFGPLAPDVLQRLEAMPADKVEELIPAILDAKSLDDLGLTAEASGTSH